MNLKPRTLEYLRDLINEATEYRSGPELVKFFNRLGFHDTYGQGFPSRWKYTDEKLQQINGRPELDQCIRAVLDPVNFVARIEALDKIIAEFNKYLAFDKWKIFRTNEKIEFVKLQKIEIPETAARKEENEFLQREFTNITVEPIGLEGAIIQVLNERIQEIERTFSSGAFLSTVILAGSTLEGVFLGLATKHPRQFNSANSSPKDKEGKVFPLHKWSLSSYIDVALELKLIQRDTHRFSHALRDFRNYIHPFEQLSSGFSLREHTSKICLQVLRAAISEIGENVGVFST